MEYFLHLNAQLLSFDARLSIYMMRYLNLFIQLKAKYVKTKLTAWTSRALDKKNPSQAFRENIHNRQ